MHVTSSTGNNLHAITDAKDECSELVSAIELVEDATEPDKFKKSLRIKSYKAYEWLQSERTVYDLLTCTLTTRMAEKIMWEFFKWQKQEAWLSLETSPLIQMANMRRSPVVQAIQEIGNLMINSTISSMSNSTVSLDDLLEGTLDSDSKQMFNK